MLKKFSLLFTLSLATLCAGCDLSNFISITSVENETTISENNKENNETVTNIKDNNLPIIDNSTVNKPNNQNENGGGNTTVVIPENTSEVVKEYYKEIDANETGSTLKQQLNSLNSKKRLRCLGYAATKTYGKRTEQDWTGKANVSGKMYGFYNNALVADHWDNQSTWNREHVWPSSLGGGSVEDDMHMARPTSVSINSERGNKLYGTTSGLYDPGQYEVNYRGVAARIIFYCAIANTNLNIVDSNSGNSSSMGKLSDLLKWNLEYLPSTSEDAHLTLRIEQNRNNVIAESGLQGNRNPFVDHPEYACKIWGNTNSTTKSICGIK